MVGVQTQVKKLQETSNGAPYVYFDRKLIRLLGLESKVSVEVEYDFDNREIRVHKSSLCSSQEASKV